MTKHRILAYLLSFGFIIAAVAFWYDVSQIYAQPYLWTQFNNDWTIKTLILGVFMMLLVIFSSLLVILRLSKMFSFIVYLAGAAAMFIFLPPTPITLIMTIIFVFAFYTFEDSNAKLFHNFITIDFRNTYTRTIPGLVTTLALIISIGHFQASFLMLDTFKFTVPDSWVGQATDLILQNSGISGAGAAQSQPSFLPPPATGAATSGSTGTGATVPQTTSPSAGSSAAITNDPELDSQIDQLIDQQLQQFNITDPAQQALVRDQLRAEVAKRVGTTGAAEPAVGFQETPIPPDAQTNPVEPQQDIMPIPAIMPQVDLQSGIKDQVQSMARTEFQRQVNTLVDQYRQFIPFISAFAVFTILNILNLPIMFITIGLVVVLMGVLKRLNIISVVKVKMDVERLAL